MKKSFLLTICYLFFTSLVTANDGILSQPLSGKAFAGKRYIEGKEALSLFQEEAKQNKEIKEQEVNKDFFFKNYKRLFSKIFAKDESGQVIQIRKLDESGQWESLVEKNAKIKPINAQEAWSSLEFADELLLIESQAGPCGFCDGARYVIYFPEEFAAFKEHIKKYHKQHDPRYVSSSRYQAAKKEQRSLAARANTYDWGEIPELSRSSDEYACCWTQLHEKGNKKFRHTCPVCKGKKTIPVKRIVRFIIDKES